MASAARNERERPVLLASFSSLVRVERSTRTENVSVFICVQYSTTHNPDAFATGLLTRTLRWTRMAWRLLGEDNRDFVMGVWESRNMFHSPSPPRLSI